MKLKSIVLAVASVLFVLGAHAQPYYVDLASPNTNIVDTYGTLTVSNTALYGITNAPFHNHSTNIVTGEYVLTAFQKQNSNTVWLAAQGVTNYDLWMNLNNYVFLYALTNGGTGYTFYRDTVTNCNFTGGIITNSSLTNCTVAGSLEGVTSGTGSSGQVPVANGGGGWDWGSAGGSYPDITDTGGNVGISQPSPAYPLDIGGSMEIGFTAGGNGDYIQGDDGSGNIILQPSGIYGTVKINDELDVDVGANIMQLSPDGFSMNYSLFFLPGSALTAGDSADFGTDGSISVASTAFQVTTSGTMQNTLAGNGDSIQIDNGSGQIVLTEPSGVTMDDGAIYSDGAGNLTAQTFIPLSDRTLKQNIVALDPATALAMAASLTNYSWQFKGRTNTFNQIVHARVLGAVTSMWSTNSITHLSRLHSITNSTVITTTNLVTKIIPASGRQFGPMAQDWHAATGLDDGHHISVTAMQGLLLGSIQALNLKQAAITAQDTNAGTIYLKLPETTITHSTNSTFGNGAGLMAVDANYLYISTGINTWRRIALPVNSW